MKVFINHNLVPSGGITQKYINQAKSLNLTPTRSSKKVRPQWLGERTLLDGLEVGANTLCQGANKRLPISLLVYRFRTKGKNQYAVTPTKKIAKGTTVGYISGQYKEVDAFNPERHKHWIAFNTDEKKVIDSKNKCHISGLFRYGPAPWEKGSFANHFELNNGDTTSLWHNSLNQYEFDKGVPAEIIATVNVEVDQDEHGYKYVANEDIYPGTPIIQDSESAPVSKDKKEYPLLYKTGNLVPETSYRQKKIVSIAFKTYNIDKLFKEQQLITEEVRDKVFLGLNAALNISEKHGVRLSRNLELSSNGIEAILSSGENNFYHVSSTGESILLQLDKNTILFYHFYNGMHYLDAQKIRRLLNVDKIEYDIKCDAFKKHMAVFDSNNSSLKQYKSYYSHLGKLHKLLSGSKFPRETHHNIASTRNSIALYMTCVLIHIANIYANKGNLREANKRYMLVKKWIESSKKRLLLYPLLQKDLDYLLLENIPSKPRAEGLLYSFMAQISYDTSHIRYKKSTHLGNPVTASHIFLNYLSRKYQLIDIFLARNLSKDSIDLYNKILAELHKNKSLNIVIKSLSTKSPYPDAMMIKKQYENFKSTLEKSMNDSKKTTVFMGLHMKVINEFFEHRTIAAYELCHKILKNIKPSLDDPGAKFTRFAAKECKKTYNKIIEAIIKIIITRLNIENGYELPSDPAKMNQCIEALFEWIENRPLSKTKDIETVITEVLCNSADKNYNFSPTNTPSNLFTNHHTYKMIINYKKLTRAIEQAKKSEEEGVFECRTYHLPT